MLVVSNLEITACNLHTSSTTVWFTVEKVPISHIPVRDVHAHYNKPQSPCHVARPSLWNVSRIFPGLTVIRRWVTAGRTENGRMFKLDDSAFCCADHMCVLGYTLSPGMDSGKFTEWQTDYKYAVMKLMKYLLTIFLLYHFFPRQVGCAPSPPTWHYSNVTSQVAVQMRGFSSGYICISRCKASLRRPGRRGINLGFQTSCMPTSLCHIQVMATGKSIIQSALNLRGVTHCKHAHYAWTWAPASRKRKDFPLASCSFTL